MSPHRPRPNHYTLLYPPLFISLSFLPLFLFSSDNRTALLPTPFLLQCILYDRPPHTASTTISVALTSCLESRNYTTTTRPFQTIPKTSVISDLLQNQTSLRRSATTKHLLISADDVFAFKQSCHKILYISSTRPMKERILSSAKYVQHEGHGDSLLSYQQAVKAAEVAQGDLINERRLEEYPFTGGVRMEPHYVVRYEKLDSDLGRLLEALGCPWRFEGENRHQLSDQKSKTLLEEAMKGVDLKFGDALFKELMAVAETGNERGLMMARNF